MEQMSNEHTIYNAALCCRLSKDDEQAGESVSIRTQKMILEKFCKEHDFRYYDSEIGRFINADGYVSTGQGVLGNNICYRWYGLSLVEKKRRWYMVT